MDCVKIIAKALSNTERIKVYDIKGKNIQNIHGDNKGNKYARRTGKGF